jgi:predicted DCC family thiol-disulfide oxidoreductase YuxK
MDPAYDPTQYGGVTFEAAMGRIHALKADGTVLQGVEVFRQLYSVLGIGWIYAATRWPVIRPLVDALYDRWADWRLAVTGRPPLVEIAQQRRNKVCSSNRCQPSLPKSV